MSWTHLGNRTLADVIRHRARECSEKLAAVFVDSNQALTYGELDTESESAACGFQGLGVERGNRVFVLLDNSPQFVLTWLALAKLGAVMVPVNPACTRREFGNLVELVSPKVIVCGAATDAVIQSEVQIPVVLATEDHQGRSDGSVAWPELLRQGPSCIAGPGPQPTDPTEIVFTSGSTAVPKGVVISHQHALHSGELSARLLALQPADRNLCVLPLFHINAQWNSLWASILSGSCVYFTAKFSSSRWLATVRENDITTTALVGSLARMLLEMPVSPMDRDHKLRSIWFANISISVADWIRFEDRYGVPLLNGYGLTEVGRATMVPLGGDRRIPSIGLPAHGREIRVVDDEGEDVKVDEVGEIVIRAQPAHSLMSEYFQDSRSTDEVLKEGWLYTGDRASVDADGYFFFAERRRDVIKRGGENVSASEVEDVLRAHAAVSDAAVIAIPDDFLDEAVVAYVELVAGIHASPEALTQHCRSLLAPFKVPSRVSVISRLPRTSVGKVDKRSLTNLRTLS